MWDMRGHVGPGHPASNPDLLHLCCSGTSSFMHPLCCTGAFMLDLRSTGTGAFMLHLCGTSMHYLPLNSVGWWKRCNIGLDIGNHHAIVRTLLSRAELQG